MKKNPLKECQNVFARNGFAFRKDQHEFDAKPLKSSKMRND